MRNSGSFPMYPSTTTISCSAMYLSWVSAHLAASSVETAWFWPSGSSVTRNVEPFERASTSRLHVEVPVLRRTRGRHLRGERLDLLRGRVLDHPLRLRQPEQHLRHV